MIGVWGRGTKREMLCKRCACVRARGLCGKRRRLLAGQTRSSLCTSAAAPPAWISCGRCLAFILRLSRFCLAVVSPLSRCCLAVVLFHLAFVSLLSRCCIAFVSLLSRFLSLLSPVCLALVSLFSPLVSLLSRSLWKHCECIVESQ